MENGEGMKRRETNIDRDIWHVLAGSIIKIPHKNLQVFYFPQGHGEHTLTDVDFGCFPNIPSMIPCRIIAARYLVNPESDEIYAIIRLDPLLEKNIDFGSNDMQSGDMTKCMSSEKILTQSDANNGGGLSVPRNLAETILPPLDYSANPPVQDIFCKDVHGGTWKFRHIHRGTPLRHLLTTGWSNFVNQKRLIAGDSVVFIRAENGELFIGVRKAKKSFSLGGSFDERNSKLLTADRKVRPESVLEAAYLAASSQPFEVEYYPRSNTSEFCVSASSVAAAMRIQWCSGMTFQMALETDETSKVSWFTGTVNSFEIKDPHRWPDSPWKSLQVTWDEPKRLQNVKCVNPWSVEIKSGVQFPPLSLFCEKRKKLRASFGLDFPFEHDIPIPSFARMPLVPNNPLFVPEDDMHSGKQGARQGQAMLADLGYGNKFQMGLFPSNCADLHPCPNVDIVSKTTLDDKENVSCNLSIGSSRKVQEKPCEQRTPQFLLFGQPIFAEVHESNEDIDANAAYGSITTVSNFGVTTSSPRAELMRAPASALGSDQLLEAQRDESQGLDSSRSE